MRPDSSGLAHVRPDLARKLLQPRSHVLKSAGAWAFGAVAVLALCLFIVPTERQAQAPVHLVQGGAKLPVLAPTDGKLALMARPGQALRQGDAIAIVGDPSEVEAVLAIERYIPELKRDVSAASPLAPSPDFINVPVSLDEQVATLRQAISAFRAYAVQQPDARLAEEKRESIAMLRERQGGTQTKIELLRSAVDIAERKLEARQSLVEAGFASRQSTLDLERDVIAARLAALQEGEGQSRLNGEIASLERGAIADSLRAVSTVKRLRDEVGSAASSVQAATNAWRRAHVAAAAVAGVFHPYEQRHRFDTVQNGQELGVLVTASGGLKARAYVPAFRASEIEIGQTARLMLDSYPSRENGFLKARVRSKSAYLQNGSYYIELEIESMRTSRGKIVTLAPGEPGTVQIILERRSAIRDIIDLGYRSWFFE